MSTLEHAYAHLAFASVIAGVAAANAASSIATFTQEVTSAAVGALFHAFNCNFVHSACAVANVGCVANAGVVAAYATQPLNATRSAA